MPDKEENDGNDLRPMPEAIKNMMISGTACTAENVAMILNCLYVLADSLLDRTNRDMFREIFPEILNSFSNNQQIRVDIVYLIERFDEEDTEEDKVNAGKNTPFRCSSDGEIISGEPPHDSDHPNCSDRTYG